MQNLSPTKYPNVQRTVKAIDSPAMVYDNDVVLNCDTSTGAITILLPKIPYDTTSLVGFWSTQWKLYINDSANLAQTNNITVVAGAGQTINGQASVTINTNGQALIVQINGNTEFFGVTAPANAINPNAIVVTYAQLSALIAANNLVPNATYNVTDAEFGSTPIIPTSIYIKSITTNTVSPDGNGYFFNADYDNNGNYSGIPGFSGFLGIWNTTIVPPVNSVVIWNNFHYLNISGANGASNPSADNINWQVLPYSVTNGYILEIDVIGYRVTDNKILFREDIRGNEVERTVRVGWNSLNVFKWGSVAVRQNKVVGNSLFVVCNANLISNPSIFYNKFEGSILFIGDLNTLGGSVDTLQYNDFSNATVTFANNIAQFNKNFLKSVELSGINFGTIENNTFENLVALSIVNTGNIRFNTWKNLRTCTLSDNSGNIDKNFIEDGNFIITNNSNNIVNNFIVDAFLSVVENTGSINDNNITFKSGLDININRASVALNNITQTSQLLVNVENTATGGVRYFSISETSTVTLGTVNKIIGFNIQGSGIKVGNSCTLRINNFDASNGFYGINIINSSTVEIDNFNNGSINTTTIDKSLIYLSDMNNQSIVNCSFKGVSLGNSLLTYVLQQTITDATAISGLSDVSFQLDCSNASIYDVLTQTLTIPTDIASIGGIYYLTNAAGITIAKIDNLSILWRTTFYNDNGTTTFQSVAVAGAVALEIVSDLGPAAINVVYRALGQDSVVVYSHQTLTVVKERNILA